jgi:probable HAF family extracellular repeat protein
MKIKRNFLFLVIFSLFLVLGFQTWSHAETDVTGSVGLVKSALAYNRANKTSYLDVNVRNTGSDPLLTPLKVVIDSISTSAVKVANADGVTSDGKPYFQYSFANALAPGQLTTAKRWIFSNPTQARFSYSIKVIGTVSYLRINGMNPSAALPGETVTLTFSGDSGVRPIQVALSSLTVDGVVLSQNTLTFTVPAEVQTGPLFLNQGGRVSNSVILNISDARVVTPTADEIVLDEFGNQVAVNLVVVSMKTDHNTYAEALRVAALQSGTIVGLLPLIDGYQVRLTTQTLNELRAAIAVLQADPAVDFVLIDFMVKPFQTATGWENQGYLGQHESNWVIDGANLYVGNVHPTDPNKIRPKSVKIGVVESELDFNADDFQGYATGVPEQYSIAVFGNDSSDASSHGTTVAGVIAARLNNGGATTGKNAGLLAALKDSHGGFEINVSRPGNSTAGAIVATHSMLLSGSTVINWSLGHIRAGTLDRNGDPANPRTANIQGADDFYVSKIGYQKLLSNIETNYPNVVIVAAANNSVVRVEANNVVPAGIPSSSMIVVGGNEFSDQGQASFWDWVDDPNYMEGSGYGNQVDILAASRVMTSSGSGMVGTSFAAPLITATVAAMQSINPKLTPSQIRHLLRRSSTGIDANVHDSTGDYVATRPLNKLEVGVDPQREGKAAVLSVRGAIQAAIDSMRIQNSPPSAPNPKAPLGIGTPYSNIDFTWSPSIDPEGDYIEYCITIKEDSYPEDIPIYMGCDLGSFFHDPIFRTSLDPGKKYWWAVWAMDTMGNWSPASAWASFTTAAVYKVSGKVTSGGIGLEGVAVTLDGVSATTTDAGGNYQFDDILEETYNISFAKAGYTFNPSQVTITLAGADLVLDMEASYTPILPPANANFSFMQIDYPNGNGSAAYGINDAGQIVGSYWDSNGRTHGFTLNGTTYTSVDYPGAIFTDVYGVNTDGLIVGRYGVTSSNSQGFLLSGTTYTPVNYPGATWGAAEGINATGQIVGYHTNSSGGHGFILNGTTYTPLPDYPGAIWAAYSGIDATGRVVGTYVVNNGSAHGFILSNGAFTTLDFPGATQTSASGINDAGQIVGIYWDSIGRAHGFILNGTTYTPVDYPGARETVVYGISAAGRIAGRYTDSGGISHGFVATPTSLMTFHFTPTGQMATPRYAHTATLLQNGKVLISAGVDDQQHYYNSAELYDRSTGAFSNTGSLGTIRAGHRAVLLPNGKVLIAGGHRSNDPGSYTNTVELYDPTTGSFSYTGHLNTARGYFAATLLNSGKVLIVGGSNGGGSLSSAELYDPATGTFVPTGNMKIIRGWFPTVSVLPDGKALITGGSESLSAAEIYDPATGTFALTGSMSVARMVHTATFLNNGKVLIAGGTNNANNVPNYFDTAELYDPGQGTFSATGSMTRKSSHHTATLLQDGMLLIAGGSNAVQDALNTTELYDPATGTFTAIGNMTDRRYYHTATLLMNGEVLIVGGYNSTSGTLSSAELYGQGITGKGIIRLPRTGQTRSWNSSGSEIPCAGTGQDGDIQAGAAWPNPRFTPGTGTEADCMVDNLTGLMWPKNANYFNGTKNWDDAIDSASNLTLCGHSDWRLPNENELESLTNADASDNAAWLMSMGLTSVQRNFYWSSTTQALYPLSAWVIDMWDSAVTYDSRGKAAYNYVWPVRGVSGGSSGPSAIWKTGQTTSYRAGDDGDFEMGIASSDPRFTLGTGTEADCIVDKLTGLMWPKNANYFNGVKNWGDAIDSAGNLTLCGHSDWRLPNKKELRTLVNYSHYLPALDAGHPFANVRSDSYYWSSTTSAYDATKAWIVNISGGASARDAGKNNAYYLWPVRAGQ